MLNTKKCFVYILTIQGVVWLSIFLIIIKNIAITSGFRTLDNKTQHLQQVDYNYEQVDNY